MKIVRLNERFKINLDGIIVTVSPMSGSQKIEMTSLVKQGVGGKLVIDRAAQEHYLIKHTVKAIEGLKDLEDKDYQLEFQNGTGTLTDECAEEVLSFMANTYFTWAHSQAMSGHYGKVKNPFNDQDLEGVTVERLIKKEDEEKK